jgi:hypothetical protein
MRVRSVIAAVAASAAALTVASPAQAGTVTSYDRTGDTSRSDIVSVRTVNGPNRLLVTVDHRNLRTGEMEVYVDTHPSYPGPEIVLGTGVLRDTDWHVYRLRNWRGVGPDPHPDFDCDSDVSWNRAAGTVTVSFGNRCRRGRGSVRIAAVAYPEGARVDWSNGFHRFGPAVPRS